MNEVRKLLVGVHVQSSPEKTNSMLLSLWEFTPQPFELVLLADGPDEEMVSFLASCTQIRQSTTTEKKGSAACFNRLVTEFKADVYLFLEDGITFSDGWLDHLLAALDADRSHGLAGPSSNHSWNEQQASPYEATEDGFCASWQELTPLYSLADFCLAVKREVIDRIGLADEVYGCGPCWEMDFNIRAARSGFKGVWAKQAYLYRSPSEAEKIQIESELFEKNKQHYQDKFCTLRSELNCVKAYCSHCEGDDCEYFVKLFDNNISRPTVTNPIDKPTKDCPLVSCIMPTCNRADFVSQSIHYFLEQDYPNRELIIIYEKESDLPEIPDDAYISLVQSEQGTSIGEKRNLGIGSSSGSIVAQWDDDDWYASQRLTVQIEPILLNIAEITALKGTLFFDLNRWEFWGCSQSLFDMMFVENIHGGTLIFRKKVWQELSRYPHTSLREDADFMQGAMRQGARLCRIPGYKLFIYLRHGMNSWKFQEGRFMEPSGWKQVSEPVFFELDKAFYKKISTPPMKKVVEDSVFPLVSCIMPTANRRKFIPDAIRYFQKQDYPNRELIVLDDGEEMVADLIPDAANIRYIRLEKKHSLGVKRNMACEVSNGEIIMHWDDDDWRAEKWVSSQVDTLVKQKADICGLKKILFYAPDRKKAWHYIYDSDKPWVYGGTLAYTKAIWRKNPFQDMNTGEDNVFLWSKQAKKIVAHDGYALYISTVHDGNTSPKQVSDRRWHECPMAEIERIMNY